MLHARFRNRGGSIVPRDAKLIEVHSDAGEIGRIRDVTLGIAADVGATLEALTAAAGDARWPDWSAWAAQATSMKDLQWEFYRETETPGGIHPFHAAAEVCRVAGREVIYVVDGGEAGIWGGAHARVNGPGRYLGTGYLGCLGVGPGFSIGAQIACPDRRVVQITGDGAMGFHIQEFDTMVRRKLPIVTAVLNNQVWGMSIHGQQIMYGKDYSAISKLGDTRYADIAVAFGCHGETVTRYKEIASAMERALASGKPACLDIRVDAEVVHPGTVAALGAHGKADEIMIPYYENIPLRRR